MLFYLNSLMRVAIVPVLLLAGARAEKSGEKGIEDAAVNRDCEVGSWSQWTECPEICGTGWHMKERKITVKKKNDGKECPDLWIKKTCNTEPCYTFSLTGKTGNEIVWVEEQKSPTQYIRNQEYFKKYTLKKNQALTIPVQNMRKVVVYFINGKFNTKGKDTGTKNAATFTWGDNIPLGVRFEENTLPSVPITWLSNAGAGPEYVSSQGGFNCGEPDEHAMCSKARKGVFQYTGKYMFTFPLSTPAPSAEPTPAPSPAPTLPPSATPTPAPTPTPTAIDTLKWQMITDGIDWVPSTGYMYSGDNGKGAAGESLHEASIVYFKASESSYSSVGFMVGDQPRDFEADRTRLGRPLIPCMMKMGGGSANPMLRLYEWGSSKGTSPEMNFASEDIIGLGIDKNGLVSFYKNGEKFRECSQILEFPVHIDVVINSRQSITFLGLEH